LVPFFASIGLVGYVSYKEINDYLHRKEHAWVNKDYCKSKNKIADIISKSEIISAIDKNDKVAYCRCWKSKTVKMRSIFFFQIKTANNLIYSNFFKFPYCDGAHSKHNTLTGDNVGPLVFKS
jgi:hypothetical protein